ncbi:hypothetical protein MATL_G00132640 [Megalops atlanticus]|uniref:Syndecan n=1 Tax=Megalops atlanticus TaxID=7932 RepID=A0A9D3PWQ8_MEGAT|nr:hypothetical protein MATL_G00132640 [Megalops atlanticus]
MSNIWIIWTCGVVAFLTGERIGVVAQSRALGEDLYLDEQQSGDYPVDDDDFPSASGSGLGEPQEETDSADTLYIAPKAESTQDPTKDLTLRVETFTFRDTPRIPARTETPLLFTEEASSRNEATRTTSTPKVVQKGDRPIKMQSEDLLQRTEVLAAVVAGGVIGFLFAIFLILLLVYRMRKKDEGSYDLGERKPTSSAYQKAPTKEFYA